MKKAFKKSIDNDSVQKESDMNISANVTLNRKPIKEKALDKLVQAHVDLKLFEEVVRQIARLKSKKKKASIRQAVEFGLQEWVKIVSKQAI